eukprot:Pgem_evm1s549
MKMIVKVSLYNSSTDHPVRIQQYNIGALGASTPTTSPCSKAEYWTWERCRSGRKFLGVVSKERTVIQIDFYYNAVSLKIRHQRNNGGLISF